jgi:hypothetical protein
MADDDARLPSVRASDREREAVIGRLRDAAAEGRLTFEELADRIELAAGAVTRGDLERLTADLPVATGAPPPVPAHAPARSGATTVFGDVRRRGAWVVPAAGRWNTVFGNVVLDLREARVTAPEMRIEANTVFGDVELLVPEGVSVEIGSWTVFGDVKQEAGEAAVAGAPRIVLTGGTVFGDVKVRSRRLRERVAERIAAVRRPE